MVPIVSEVLGVVVEVQLLPDQIGDHLLTAQTLDEALG
jgi:hypothetical protein